MSLINNQNYGGSAANEYIGKAILGANTIEKKLVTLVPNVKKKTALKFLDEGNIIQAGGCSFNAQGDITLSEKWLEPVDLKVNTKFCVDDLRSTWEADKLTAGANNNNVTFEAFVIDRYVKQVAKGLDDLIWKGKEAGTSGIYLTYPFLKELDGFNTLFTADTAVIDVPTPVALTVANIIGKMTDALILVPDEIKHLSDLTIYASPADSFTLKLALNTSGAMYNYDVTKSLGLAIAGVPVETVNLPTGTFIITYKSNLYFSTDLLSDATQVRMWDMGESDGSDYVGFKMKFTAGIQYGFGDHIVKYN